MSFGELKIVGLLFDVRDGRALERLSRFDGRTKMSDNADAAPPSERRITKTSQAMRGNELIKKVETLGKERRIAVRVDKKRGKGSHQTLYFGERKTIIRNPKDELKTGTYHAMLKQLGISEKDLK